MNNSIEVTCIAPINIAVIKYWGKRCEEKNLPLNSSLSVTLDVDDLCSRTTVTIDNKLTDDVISLNGKDEEVNLRLKRCLDTVRDKDDKRKCRIVSSNNFPTAAGLASSAAGYACLAKCLSTLYNTQARDISTIARLGSGSACRSVYGGFVKWCKGEKSDGLDSIAVQIADENHWKELKCLILVVSNKEKSVGSTEAMRRSAQNSQLLKYRIEHCVEEKMKKIEEAILKKDFETFAQITMQESNQMHAVCQDTYPPVIYMNQTSHNIVELVTQFNADSVKACYTFDAGPNAVLFTEDKNFPELLATVLKYFPNNQTPDYINIPQSEISNLSEKAVTLPNVSEQKNDLQRIIVTMAGRGACVV